MGRLNSKVLSKNNSSEYIYIYSIVSLVFKQTALTVIGSLQCLSLKVNLVSSVRPLSFSLQTFYVTHIRQPIKCHFPSHFRSHANQWPVLPQRSQKEDTFDG